MAGDGRPRHCGRRADEAWPHGPYAYLPRGGICYHGEPRSRRPVAAGSPPGHPAHRAAGQWRSRSDAASPPGPVRRAAAPARPRSGDTADRGDPAGEGGPGPAGRDLLPGKRPACRVCYTPPASAATARGDVAAGRRGRIAGMTALMLPAWPQSRLCRWLAQRATSSLPAMRCGSMACSPQPGGAEQPVLVPLLRWSSPAQVALPAVLRPARRFLPSAGTDLVAGRVVLLEAEPAGWTWQQGPGQRASPAGAPGPAAAGLSGSRTARTVPARPARQASPLF
jgi:hypothetical protein